MPDYTESVGGNPFEWEEGQRRNKRRKTNKRK